MLRRGGFAPSVPKMYLKDCRSVISPSVGFDIVHPLVKCTKSIFTFQFFFEKCIFILEFIEILEPIHEIPHEAAELRHKSPSNSSWSDGRSWKVGCV